MMENESMQHLRARREEDLRRRMREDLERTLDDRVARYVEVAHQGIVPNHHFAAASSECIDVYRDGHSLSAVMVSQAVTEGIWRFVLERNDVQADQNRAALAAMLVKECGDAFGRIWRSFWSLVRGRNGQPHRDRPGLAATLVNQKILSQECAEAFGRIWRSFRNDVHHMNPGVSAVPFKELAKRNLIDLAVIEREIFGVTFDDGKLVPLQPRYWDLREDGTTSVFLRNPWVGL